MAVEVEILANFTGGEISIIGSTEPQENDWLLLEGFVLDENGRLRSQWAGASWEIELAEAS
jgi:hypothetical protein